MHGEMYILHPKSGDRMLRDDERERINNIERALIVITAN